MKRVYFVRHGETDANVHQRIPDHTEPLNGQGIVQVEALANRIKHLDIDKIISSDFKRAFQTAEAIASIRDLPVETNTVFREIMEPSSMFGLFEDDTRAIQYRQDRNENIEDVEWRQEDGESLYDAFERTRTAQSFLEQNPAENILVVSHVFFLKMFAATVVLNVQTPTDTWLQTGKVLKVSNAGISFCTLNDKEWHILTWNDHAHFAE